MVKASPVKSFTIPNTETMDLGNGIKAIIKDGKLTMEIILGQPLGPTFDKATGVGRKNWSYASTKGNVELGNGMKLGLNLFGVQPKDLGK